MSPFLSGRFLNQQTNLSSSRALAPSWPHFIQMFEESIIPFRTCHHFCHMGGRPAVPAAVRLGGTSSLRIIILCLSSAVKLELEISYFPDSETEASTREALEKMDVNNLQAQRDAYKESTDGKKLASLKAKVGRAGKALALTETELGTIGEVPGVVKASQREQRIGMRCLNESINSSTKVQ
eukprot:scaffold10568_cov140-Skeletonema_dohrnii-CCMP3373.AAC.9